MTDEELLTWCRDRLANTGRTERAAVGMAVFCCYQRLVELLAPPPAGPTPPLVKQIRGDTLEEALAGAKAYQAELEAEMVRQKEAGRAKDPHFLFVWRHKYMVACATGRTEQEAAAKFSEDCDLTYFSKAQQYPVASDDAYLYRNHE